MVVKLSDRKSEFSDEFLTLTLALTQRTTKHTLQQMSLAIFLDFSKDSRTIRT